MKNNLKYFIQKLAQVILAHIYLHHQFTIKHESKMPKAKHTLQMTVMTDNGTWESAKVIVKRTKTELLRAAAIALDKNSVTEIKIKKVYGIPADT